MDKSELEVGQSVVVIAGIPNRRRHEGKVDKIARKYVTVKYWAGIGRPISKEFDIETQRERDGDCNYAAIFRTLGQQEAEDRERAVRDALRFYGLMPKYTGPLTKRTLTLDQMEQVVKLLDEIVGRD